MRELAAGPSREQTEERIDRTKPAHPSRLEIRLNLREEISMRAGCSQIERLPIDPGQILAIAFVVGRRIAEPWTHVCQIRAGDDHRTGGVLIDDRAESPEKLFHARVTFRTMAGALAISDAAENRDDSHLAGAHEVPHEHRLELERMLPFVVEHVGKGIEARLRG